MQCVILAAGKGTRMRPLTETTPKPLIEVAGKPILDHIIERLPSEIDEIILVTNYLEDQIKARYGSEWQGRAIKYVTQENPSGGTGQALMCAKELITGKFLMLNGDDIYGAEGLQKLAATDQGLFAFYSDQPELFGVIEQNEDGTMKHIIEKPENPTSNFTNINGYAFQPEVFNYEPEADARLGEILVTDMATGFAADFPMQVIEQDFWLPIGNHEQLAKAEAVLRG